MQAFLFSVFILLFMQPLFAGSGKAIVSHWYAFDDGRSNTQHSNFFISNITQNDLVVTIKLYDKDGTIYSSGLTYNNFQNSNTEIGAGKSVNFKINASTNSREYHGYAVIEWKNKENDDDLVGLVAWGDWQQDTPQRAHSIQINNGNPF